MKGKSPQASLPLVVDGSHHRGNGASQLRPCLLVAAALLCLCCVGAHVPSERNQRELYVQTLRQAVLERLHTLATRGERERDAEEAERTESSSPPTSGVSPTAAVVTLPEPPRALGVHTACRKFGRGCPEEYVTFLQEYLASLPPVAADDAHAAATRVGGPEAPPEPANTRGEGSSRDGEGRWRGTDIGGTSFSVLPFPTSPDWSVAEVTHLERLQQYITVLEGRLGRAVTSPSRSTSATAAGKPTTDDVAFPPRYHCWWYTLRTWLAEGMLGGLSLVLGWWGFLWWQLLPCTAIVALGAWVFTVNSLTPEETEFVLEAVSEQQPANPQLRRAEEEASDLSGGGDRASNSPENGSRIPPSAIAGGGTTPTDDDGTHASQLVSAAGATADVAEAEYEAHCAYLKRQRRTAVSFILLDRHFQQEVPLIFLKLRVALCLGVLAVLTWAVLGGLWYGHSLFSPSPSPTSLWGPPLGSADGGGTAMGYSRYLARARSVSAATIQWVARGALSRMLPSWLLTIGQAALALVLVGSSFLLAVKGLLEAWEKLETAFANIAADRENVLGFALGP